MQPVRSDAVCNDSATRMIIGTADCCRKSNDCISADRLTALLSTSVSSIIQGQHSHTCLQIDSTLHNFYPQGLADGLGKFHLGGLTATDICTERCGRWPPQESSTHRPSTAIFILLKSPPIPCWSSTGGERRIHRLPFGIVFEEVCGRTIRELPWCLPCSVRLQRWRTWIQKHCSMAGG